MLRQRVFCLNNSFKVVKPIATQELLINEEIRDKEVRLIDEKGEQLGIVKIEHALRIADEKELDLVKIVPNANPPVCKIMDYGKARFEQIKREKEQRRNQTVVETKENPSLFNYRYARHGGQGQGVCQVPEERK